MDANSYPTSAKSIKIDISLMIDKRTAFNADKLDDTLSYPSKQEG